MEISKPESERRSCWVFVAPIVWLMLCSSICGDLLINPESQTRSHAVDIWNKMKDRDVIETAEYSHFPVAETDQHHYDHSGWSNGHSKDTVEYVHQTYGHYDQHATHKTKGNPYGATTAGWVSKKPTTPAPTTPPPECLDLKDRTVLKPSDIKSPYRLVRVDGTKFILMDPEVVLNPHLQPVPPAPLQLSSSHMEKYETAFEERVSIDFEESEKTKGYSLVRDRVTSLNLTGLSAPPLISSTAVTSVVTLRNLPRLSAPLNGSDNLNFIKGINSAKIQRERGETRSPVENFILSDLQTMWDIFEQLSDYEEKTGETSVDIETSPQMIQMPVMISRSEQFFIPEPAHSEKSILDATFNFGLPASHFEFNSHSTILDEWKSMDQNGYKSLQTPEHFSRVYSGMKDFYTSMEEFVMSRMNFQRQMGAESFINVESIAQDSFSADQFLVCTDTDPECKGDCIIDPHTAASQRGSKTSGGVGIMPSCRRGRSCPPGMSMPNGIVP